MGRELTKPKVTLKAHHPSTDDLFNVGPEISFPWKTWGVGNGKHKNIELVSVPKDSNDPFPVHPTSYNKTQLTCRLEGPEATMHKNHLVKQTNWLGFCKSGHGDMSVQSHPHSAKSLSIHSQLSVAAQQASFGKRR